METDQSSIFDEDFIQETWVRRRQLMPVAMRICVWLFLIIIPVSFIVRGWIYYQYTVLPDLATVDRLTMALGVIGAFFSIGRFLSCLFLLLEKKWAIRFALPLLAIAVLLNAYSTVQLYLSGVVAMLLITNTLLLLLDVFIIMMLLKIKRDWETKALSGKELEIKRTK